MSSKLSIVTLFGFATLTSIRPSQREDASDNLIDDSNHLNLHLPRLEEFLYGLPDMATGIRMTEWRENMTVNPEELGSHAEGDIFFPLGNGRNGLRANSGRWPNAVVPYVVSLYFNEEQRKLIREAMNDYHKYTCIRFKPYRGEETDYIRITAGNSGCWSIVGRIGGWQDVNLQVPGCVTRKGTVIHELMHVVGFLHELSRFERDQFVSIRWNNILNGHKQNFDKASVETTDNFGFGYDYSSYAFPKNGKPTIIAKRPPGYFSTVDKYNQSNIKVKLGQREGLSKRDIQKIRMMYKCNRYVQHF